MVCTVCTSGTAQVAHVAVVVERGLHQPRRRTATPLPHAEARA